MHIKIGFYYENHFNVVVVVVVALLLSSFEYVAFLNDQPLIICIHFHRLIQIEWFNSAPGGHNNIIDDHDFCHHTHTQNNTGEPSDFSVNFCLYFEIKRIGKIRPLLLQTH